MKDDYSQSNLHQNSFINNQFHGIINHLPSKSKIDFSSNTRETIPFCYIVYTQHFGDLKYVKKNIFNAIDVLLQSFEDVLAFTKRVFEELWDANDVKFEYEDYWIRLVAVWEGKNVCLARYSGKILFDNQNLLLGI